MNTINTYGYMVVKNKNNITLHIVEIYTEYYHGFAVFNNSSDAQTFINKALNLINYFLTFNMSWDYTLR